MTVSDSIVVKLVVSVSLVMSSVFSGFDPGTPKLSSRRYRIAIRSLDAIGVLLLVCESGIPLIWTDHVHPVPAVAIADVDHPRREEREIVMLEPSKDRRRPV